MSRLSARHFPASRFAASRLWPIAVFALLAGCTQIAEGPGASRENFPSLYTVPARPAPGPTPAETEAMIADLQKTRRAPETAIPAQPPRPAERRAASARPAAEPAAAAEAASLRTWVATVIPAADGSLGPEDRVRLAGIAESQKGRGARLLLEAFGLAENDPAIAAVRTALVEAGWPGNRLGLASRPETPGSGPKVDIFLEY